MQYVINVGLTKYRLHKNERIRTLYCNNALAVLSYIMPALLFIPQLNHMVNVVRFPYSSSCNVVLVELPDFVRVAAYGGGAATVFDATTRGKVENYMVEKRANSARKDPQTNGR